MTIVESLLELVKLREPKRRRPPTARDEAIFAQVKVLGRTQAAVAAEFGLTQPRISQIVSRVQAWRQSEDYAKGSEDRQRGDRELDRQRLEEAYLRGMRAQEKAERAIVSQRSGERDGKPWSEKTSREQPASVQGLKAAMRAMEMMWKLEDRPQKFVHQKNSVEQLHEAIQQLHYVRRCAISYGIVKTTESPEETVQRLLQELVGDRPQQGAPSAVLAEEQPPAERSPGHSSWAARQAAREAKDRALLPTELTWRDASPPSGTAFEGEECEAERIADRVNSLGVDVDGLDPVVATALLTPTRDAPKRSAPAPQPKPITDSWIYVRVNKPDISVPLTPDERAERRKLLPKLEPIEYDDRGNRILRS